MVFSEHRADPQLSTVTGTSSRTYSTTDPELVNKYLVARVSLSELLSEHSAPPVIDYMSVDTEGTEWEILSEFDFHEYAVRVLTVEHNGEPNRTRIHHHFSRHGYSRVSEDLSAWGDWYLHPGVELP